MARISFAIYVRAAIIGAGIFCLILLLAWHLELSYNQELIHVASRNNLSASQIAHASLHTVKHWLLIFGAWLSVFAALIAVLYLQKKDVIAALEKQQSELAENSQILQQAMDRATIGKALLSLDGSWMRVNHSLCQLLGYSAEELLETNFQSITHPDDLSADLEYVKQILQGEIEHYQMQKRYIHRSGEIIWALLSVSLVYAADGAPKYFISQIQNLTPWIQAERKFRLLFEETTTPYLLLHSDLGIMEANNAAIEQLAGGNERALPRTWLSSYLSDMAGDILQKLDAALHRDGKYRVQLPLKTTAGISMDAELTFSRIKLQDAHAIMLSWYDLSEHHRIEKERESLIGRLISANNELENFAFVASHDMQEPLRMITNFSELLESEYADALAEEGQSYLHIIRKGALRLSTLIHDLLDYARADHAVDNSELFNSNDSLNFALANLGDMIRSTQASISYDGVMPVLRGNRTLFATLLQNLLSNAMKYQKAETVPHIHISSQRSESQWLLVFTDNGIGIPAEHAEHVFEPFKRLHSQEIYNGTGLGLAICRRIIHGMHGSIWVEPNPMGGSIFSLSIPVVQQ